MALTQVKSDGIATGAVTADQIAANAVTVDDIADGSISTAKLAADCVDGTKIADDAVNTEHIADDAVGADQLADTAVTAGSYTLASVTVDAQGRITAASSGTAGDSDRIFEGNTSAEVVDTGSDGHFKVVTEGTEALRVDPSRRLLVGTSSSFQNANTDTMKLLVASTTSNGLGAGFYNFQNDSNWPGIALGRSRNNTVGSHTVVNSGDVLGNITFEGSDGTAFKRAAMIQGVVDATPGTNDMPGRLVFSTTADGASSPTERLRITNNGTLQLRNSPGIDFSQIQTNAAGMTSETLDSYEEGTWTPRLTGSLGGEYTPGGGNTGWYRKVGNVVTVGGTLQWSAQVTAVSGYVIVSGLPFANGANRSGGVIGGGSGLSFTSGHSSWLASLDIAASSFYVLQVTSTSNSYSHYPTVATSGVMYGFMLTYGTA